MKYVRNVRIISKPSICLTKYEKKIKLFLVNQRLLIYDFITGDIVGRIKSFKFWLPIQKRNFNLEKNPLTRIKKDSPKYSFEFFFFHGYIKLNFGQLISIL